MGLLQLTSTTLTRTSSVNYLSSLWPPSSAPLSTLPIIANHPLFRFEKKPFGPHPKLFSGIRTRMPSSLKEKGVMIVQALSTDDTGPDGPEPSSESEEESVPIENLPLEPKLQLKLEQKMKMKLAKKFRLRRKKLVRKRRLRKKGRWPPSKLDKNKNV